jgi:hypothetical protein
VKTTYRRKCHLCGAAVIGGSLLLVLAALKLHRCPPRVGKGRKR